MGEGALPTAPAESTAPIASGLVAEPNALSATALLHLIESPDLTVFECLNYLVTTSDSVALQFRICERLKTFPNDQIGFYLPQLVHIFITVETESAAVEDLLLMLVNSSPHFALVVFWHLQAGIHDLRSDPHSYGFSAAKRLCNKLQYVLFASGVLAADNVMRENPEPALVLAAMVAGVLVPGLGSSVKQLVLSQGRKQRSSYLHVQRQMPPSRHSRNNSAVTALDPSVSASTTTEDLSLLATGSQPDLRAPTAASSPYATGARSMPNFDAVNNHLPFPSPSPTNRLKTNYFQCETQFVYALMSISSRLLQVPKEARVSALQVELALLNEDLPAEVDLPMLFPSSVPTKQNKIVRICPSEATVLNSAEKAPYLLLIEYLRGELNFDPSTAQNREILLMDAKVRAHIFERNVDSRRSQLARPSTTQSHVTPPPSSENSALVADEADEQDISKISVTELEEMASATGGGTALDSPNRRAHANLPVSATELNAATAISETPGPNVADMATQWRIASVILAQLDTARLPRGEIATIRSRIVESMQAMQSPSGRSQAGERRLENDLKTAGLRSDEDGSSTLDHLNGTDDPSAANLGEDWNARKARIRRSSPYGHLANWDLFSVIVKTGDDLRQEALASQFIQRASQVWKQHGVGVWVRRMQILITSANSGLVETITNGLSLHSIKKALTSAQVSEGGDPRAIAQLSQHFEHKFGAVTSSRYRRALTNFVQSLAAYSLLCYIIQIKDRHNGNILVDSEGHIIHIDFGFMLSNSPGHIGFEAATFKLTQEYVDLMGGVNSDYYLEFVRLLKDAFLALRQHADEFVSFVEITGRSSTLPCFKGGHINTGQQLRARFMLHLSDSEAELFVEKMITKSYGSVYTRLYDSYQMATQGIYN